MSHPLNLGRFISIIRLLPFAMPCLAGVKSALVISPRCFPVMLQTNTIRDASVQRNADLTLLRGDGNIFVLPEEWLALPFRTEPNRKQAAA